MALQLQPFLLLLVQRKDSPYYICQLLEIFLACHCQGINYKQRNVNNKSPTCSTKTLMPDSSGGTRSIFGTRYTDFRCFESEKWRTEFVIALMYLFLVLRAEK